MKKLTDKPGRYFAIFIFSPTLFVCSIIVRKHYKKVSLILFILSMLLFFYEFYCILYKPPDILYEKN